ncbi:MAG: gamma carbonic anhydrase family protein [Candidatus Thermoplasmatota archaeon]|nr:gamma carbonic anhydrase family protein [Candidatus Thermoplasmatota archaeon]MCL5730587.1 gamma carbonic anhydrase family protein [Candidatus Thermoplasmatota archaeon]
MSIKIGKDCYIAPSAVIIGEVTIGDRVMICDHAVLRGDVNSISVGNGTNIQDSVTIHAESNSPVIIGSGVSIGHNAVVHGCTIHDSVLIGMGSVVMTGSIIGSGSVVAAGSLVKENFISDEDCLILGRPGECVKRDRKYRVMAELNSMAYDRLRSNYLQGKYSRVTGASILGKEEESRP